MWMFDIKHRERRSEIPVNHVGLLSFIFCTWLDPIMWRMFRQSDYDPIDKCQCPDLEKASANADRLTTTCSFATVYSTL